MIKCTLLLILLTGYQAFSRGYGQNKVNIDLKRVSLKYVLQQVERQTNYRFLYNDEILLAYANKTIQVEDAELPELMKKALAGTHLRYQLRENNLVVITAVQEIVARGTVKDGANLPLVGVNVRLKGTKNETSTDSNGAFELKIAQKDATLEFSYVGFLSVERAVTHEEFMEVVMQPSTTDISEVVVVGYGTQRKADVTGAIGSVGSSTIARAATPNAAGALQGQVPGVVVTKNAGKPGGGFNITIRGINSIGGSSYPLLVIDGVPSNAGLGDLNPADIEKIDVLKDASATAIYGSRGAKGVVIVTTKRGKAGKTNIAYDAYIGARTPTNLPTMMDGPAYVRYRTEMFKAQGRSTERDNAAFFTPEQWQRIDANDFTDWTALILENGLQMNHNVSASGGDEKTQFSIGAGLMEEEGNVAPESFKRYSLRGNVDRAINDKWKVGLNMYMTQNLQNIGSSEALRSAYRLPPVAAAYDENGERIFRVYGTDAVTNPMFDQENEIRRLRSFRTFGNLYLQVKPLDYLTLNSTISPSYYAERTGYYFGPFSKERLGESLPTQGNNATSEQFTWVLDNQAIFEQQIDIHKITATVVQSMQKDRTESNFITAEGLPYESLWYNLATGPTVRAYGSGFIQSTLVSYMGRVNYSFDDRFLLTATGRWDGSSRLADGNKWGFFPSASVAWRLSNEAFMAEISAVNDLKLRVSYGVSGNDRVNPYSTQAALSQTYYDFGGAVAPGYAPGQLPNKNLTWEKTGELNVGLDFSVLNGRVSGNVDVYDRKINNILLDRLLPAPSGWESITDNIGKLQNSGIEVGLNTLNVTAGEFSWRTDFVFDKNRNKILELSGGKRDDIGNRLFIGQPVQVNYDYVFDGIWQTNQSEAAMVYNQKPGQIRVKDLDNNGIINADDRQIIGKRVPEWTGSIANTFKYGDIDLYFMLYTRQGEQFNSSFDATLMNYNSPYKQVEVDYWTLDNPSEKHFQPGNPGPYAGVINYRDVSFVRVGNITLGYRLSSSLTQRLGLQNVRVYATATNPFTFTKYEGFDPEWPSQNSYGTAISSASYLFGLNLSF
ncbi:SusC/RagA family TonB-linked outer membrane protein [Sphingobacterium suaedae]|uniref:SusC/RagA family TonB-linked outer membrane protein n=1 Tax=Sphingobacterium suaedae TaxID=1686402 RepID=A0ABW5KBZ3_9SPHI